MSMVRQAERPYTAADLVELPDGGERYEVIGGELIVTPAPSTQHQWASAALMDRIRSFGLEHELGATFAAPFDVRLGRHDIVQPDILFVLRANVRRVRAWGIEGPPDLVIEVISPSSSGIDRVRKSATYAMYGISEYWIVDPTTETILAQELRDGGYIPIHANDGLIHSRILDGLVIDQRDIFETPDWMPSVAE